MTPGSKVSGQMLKLGIEIGKAPGTATRLAAIEAKTIQQAALRVASGGDLLLNRVGIKGARINAHAEPSRVFGGGWIVRAVGPVHLIEFPSKPHQIAVRAATRRKSRTGAKALNTPAGPRASVQHPGVQHPKRPWLTALPAAQAAATKIIQRQYSSAFARGLR